MQGLDRYAYVNNDPIRYTDPSGHDAWWCETASCSYNYYHHSDYSAAGELDYIKARTLQDRGVTLADGGTEHSAFKSGTSGRDWDLRNARLVDLGLSQLNNVLGGNLKGIIGSSTFTLNTHPNTQIVKGVLTDTSGWHLGYTTGTNVDFYTNSTIELQNLYHEFGHVLDNSPGHVNQYSGALQAEKNPSFLDGRNINSNALINSRVYDPYTWNHTAAAIQHKDPNPEDQYTENWADIFANYAAGNIDLSKPTGPGADMYKFISGILP